MKGEFLSLETARRLHNRRKKQYALYKGEEILAIGTLFQIAYKMGVKPRTIQFYKTPTYKTRRKNGKKYRELVKL